jgi:hypothetical protein
MLIVFILSIIVLCIFSSGSGHTTQTTIQKHTGNEVRAWLDTKEDVSLDEIIRKVKDTELQQPYVSRPVLKMTRKQIEYVEMAYPDSMKKEEYLVIITDSKGETMEDIDYLQFVSIIPLDRFIV